MSTQETAKVMTLTNGDGEGELPDDMRLKAKLYDKLELLNFSDQSVLVLGINILGRTGELD